MEDSLAPRLRLSVIDRSAFLISCGIRLSGGPTRESVRRLIAPGAWSNATETVTWSRCFCPRRFAPARRGPADRPGRTRSRYPPMRAAELSDRQETGPLA